MRSTDKVHKFKVSRLFLAHQTDQWRHQAGQGPPVSASLARQPGPRLFLDGSENPTTAAQGATAKLQHLGQHFAKLVAWPCRIGVDCQIARGKVYN